MVATPTLRQALKMAHVMKGSPDCTFGDEPHYVPPSTGTIGFYACNPPADITNHARCREEGGCEVETTKHLWMARA